MLNSHGDEKCTSIFLDILIRLRRIILPVS
jgi:hypothetical protein